MPCGRALLIYFDRLGGMSFASPPKRYNATKPPSNLRWTWCLPHIPLTIIVLGTSSVQRKRGSSTCPAVQGGTHTVRLGRSGGAYVGICLRPVGPACQTGGRRISGFYFLSGCNMTAGSQEVRRFQVPAPQVDLTYPTFCSAERRENASFGILLG